MINSTTCFNSRLICCLLLAVLLFLLPACGKRRADKIDDSIAQNPQYKELRGENKKLLQSLESLEAEIAKTNLRILEKEAQIRELEDRLDSQQKMLDEAIQEVVRAKAKLRSLESKAEAASEMAEAEIAVKALKVQLAARGEDPEVAKAEQLLKMSVEEFEKENYGGALYLTSQAKGQIKSGQMRLGDKKKLKSIEGEVLFAQPLPLQVLKNSNLREMPDLKSNILTTLDKGTLLIGYSYKDQWVRVTREDGISGWIFQTLVGGR
ncbi:MAG: SH3 domain-containing protein [Deltaproteobacteria bacterium]|nr:SH3 domain-containing protein [Deltaproteobacteria bacterium]